jgi:YfiH family protein
VPQFRFANLSVYPELLHAVLTRHGGVSQPPWGTLNLGGSVGDDPTAVNANTERMCAALGVARSHLVTAFLTHSDTVAVVSEADWGVRFRDTDALVTASPGVYLALRFADCVPILMYDPVRRVVGMTHAGWRGTLALITQKTARTMMERFGCRPGDLVVGIGPSLGPCCAEMGDEVVAQTRAVFGAEADALLIPGPRKLHLDLWAANRVQLEAIGVRQIEVSDICTVCHVTDYFSHRAEQGKTGRFGAVIGIRGE